MTKKNNEVTAVNQSQADDPILKFRQRLQRFYRHYNPAKESDIDELIIKHAGAGSEEKLFAALTRKYGPEPIDESLFATDGATMQNLVFQQRPQSWSARLKCRIFCMAMLPGGRMVVGGASNGAMEVINPVTGKVEKTATDHTDTVMSLAVGVQGIFTASADHTIKLWNLRSFELVRTFEDHEGIVMAVAVSQAMGAVGLFSAGDDKTVRQWNIDNGFTVCTYDDFEAPVNVLVCSTTHCVCGGGDGVITVIEMLKKKIVRRLDAHIGGVWSLAFDQEGVLFSGGADALIKIWPDPVQDDHCSCVLTGHSGTIRALLFFEDVLISSGEDSTVCIWDFVAAENRCIIKQVLRMIAPNGSQCTAPIIALGLSNNELTAAGFDKVIARWNIGDLLPVEMDIVPLPNLDDMADDEAEARLQQLHPRERHMHYATLDVTAAVKKYTELPINYIIESLNFKVEGSWLVNELLIFIPFLVMFLFFFLSDYSAKDLYYMNLSTVRMLGTQELGLFKTQRTFELVTDVAWWYRWATLLLIPTLWNDKNATGWHVPVRFGGQNQLIGAVRIRTKRVTNDTCSTNSYVIPEIFDKWLNPSNGTVTTNVSTNVAPFEYGGCYGPYSFSNDVDGEPFACEFGDGCVHNPAQLSDPTTFNFTSGKFEYSHEKGSRYNGNFLYRSGGYSVDIPFVKSQAEAMMMVEQLRSNGFIDTVATRFVSVEFFQYNPEIRFFVSNKLVAEVTAGGAWFTSVQHKPFRIFRYSSQVGSVVFDIFFAVFVFYWLVHYFLELRSHYKMYGTALTYIFNAWNLMDLTNIALFVAMFIVRWRWMYDSQFSSIEMPFDGRTFPEKLDDIVDGYQYQVYLNAFNTVLTMLKILKYVRLNDQLNILTRTLAMAQDSIVGVLLLFIYFVFAFAITGMSLYGSNLYGFRTIDAAYNTLMRMLVGDMDYGAMSDVHRPATIVYFWSFLIFSQFLLLNFLVAVLSDAFQEVCESRLPLPIDKAIIRAAERVKEQLLPAALRITFLLLSKRRTRTQLTAKHARFMRNYRDSILSQEALHFKDYDEVEFTYISRSFFMDNVPPELRTDDNLNFMGEVWTDMAWEWHWHLIDKHRREQHEQEELVQEVIHAELAYFNRKGPEIVDTATVLNTVAHKLRTVKEIARQSGTTIEGARGGGGTDEPPSSTSFVDRVVGAASTAAAEATSAVSAVQELAADAVSAVGDEASGAANAVGNLIGSVFGERVDSPKAPE